MAHISGSDLVDLTGNPRTSSAAADAGFAPLFDGHSLRGWEVAGAGRFAAIDGRMESVPGDDLGLCWCTVPTPPDFVLRLAWLRWRHEDTSGVFVRFPRPRPIPDGNAAFTAIQRGFEVQIDEIGIAGATPIHRTGALYDQPSQQIAPRPARAAMEWNEFEIAVRGQRYTVHLNGAPVTIFDNPDRRRGLASTAAAPSFIGLQISPGSRVAFRDIRIKSL